MFAAQAAVYLAPHSLGSPVFASECDRLAESGAGDCCVTARDREHLGYDHPKSGPGRSGPQVLAPLERSFGEGGKMKFDVGSY